MLGFIMRVSKDFKKKFTLKTLYTSLVRPHLEYASIVWSSFYNIHCIRIERIQKIFVRKRNLSDNMTPYIEHLQYFRLETLKYRREIFYVMF